MKHTSILRLFIGANLAGARSLALALLLLAPGVAAGAEPITGVPAGQVSDLTWPAALIAAAGILRGGVGLTLRVEHKEVQ